MLAGVATAEWLATDEEMERAFGEPDDRFHLDLDSLVWRPIAEHPAAGVAVMVRVGQHICASFCRVPVLPVHVSTPLTSPNLLTIRALRMMRRSSPMTAGGDGGMLRTAC